MRKWAKEEEAHEKESKSKVGYSSGADPGEMNYRIRDDREFPESCYCPIEQSSPLFMQRS